MNVLLDTHTFLWFVLGDAQLSTAARMAIEDPGNEVFISPASYWEIAIKVRLGKLDLRSTYDEFMDRGIAGNDFTILPIEPRHTARLVTLPLHHKDPFDRFLVAQAAVDNLSIVSGDTALDAYGVRRLLVAPLLHAPGEPPAAPGGRTERDVETEALAMGSDKQEDDVQAGGPAKHSAESGPEGDEWDEALLNDPRFLRRIVRARRSVREGKGVRLEDLTD